MTANLSELLATIGVHEDLDWKRASGLILPVLPRLRPYPDGMPAPLQAMVEPGIVVGVGIDIGPGFMAVTDELASAWRVTASDLVARAIANVHARAALVETSSIHHGEIDSMPTEWLQTGRSIGSTLVVAPGELCRIFGPQPRLFITPMRDLIIGLPADCPRDLALWLHAEVASGDPNCLGPTAYRFEGRRVFPEQLAPFALPFDPEAIAPRMPAS